MGARILTLSAPDRPGLVACVASRIAEAGGNIRDAQQFNDPVTDRFFMRVEFSLDDTRAAQLRTSLGEALGPLGIEWSVRSAHKRKKAVILVSKFDHCLGDLLYRTRIGELPMDIVGIIGNHPREALATGLIGELPYHHLPVTPATKPAQEQRLRALIDEAGADLVILARYMQVLSEDLCRRLAGRAINIHHSFLPGFKGAKPYHQAHARGVKMIGATAHYVTADLDEGPIITQAVEAITHRDTAEELVRKGRDIERRVLAEAVHFHLDDRILINGRKTVVFRD